MVQALLRQRVGERLHHVLLPHQRLEVARPVLAGEHAWTTCDRFYGPALAAPRLLPDNRRPPWPHSHPHAPTPAPAPLSYGGSGVDYDLIDPLKVAAQRAAAATAAHLAAHGFSEVEASRGESAYVVDVGPFYLASIVECLGSKALVADEMAALTGKSYYDGIAQDTIAMAINDLITVGATPLVVQAYWAAGGSDWFADASARPSARRRLEARLRRTAASPGAAARRRRWPASSKPGRIDLAAVVHRPRQPEGAAVARRPARRRRRDRAAAPRAASTPTA